MPLFGRHIFNGPVENVELDTAAETYTIPHTGEFFTSKEQYDDRVQLYNRKLWTCQCTGHINLTHKEALESEKSTREMLSKSFSDIYEEDVLRITHHSSDVLDKIVNKSYKLLRSQLFVNETVVFEAMAGKKHEAKVVKVYEDVSNTAGTGSPSSDKENNSSKQSLITDMFNKTEKSPDHSQKLMESSSEDSSSQSLEMNRMKYDILLTNENKIVRGVPTKTLRSITKRPTRLCLKLFIRSNAIGHEYKKQKIWIVNKAMVEKYNLSGRLTAEEEKKFINATTYSVESCDSIDYQHQPLTNGVSHTESSSDEKPTMHHKNLNSPENSGDNPNSSSRIVKVAPIFKVKFRDSPHIVKTNGLEYISSTPPKSESKKQSTHKEKGGSKRKQKDSEKTTTKKIKKSSSKDIDMSDEDDDKPLSLLKAATASKASSRKNTSPKKKRQATLLELTRKKGGTMLMTSKKSHALGSSPAKKRAPRQPPIVYMLLRLKRAKTSPLAKYRKLVINAAKMLTEKQRQNLPELVKQDILSKWEMLEWKKKWDSMTIEERKQFRAAEREEKNKKFEDMDIVEKGKAEPLPMFEPAVIPGNLPNTMFGDIALVTEFLNSYKSILFASSREVKLSNHWALAEALSAGKKGYDSISHIMIHILYVLLSDDIARDYKELDFNINKVPITAEVCSELARICLRQLDDDLEEGNEVEDDSAKITGTGISEEVFSRLLENEMYELEPSDQLEVLCALTYRFLNTYTAQNYRDEAKDKLRNAWKKLNKMRCENKQLRKEKKKQKMEEESSRTDAVTPEKVTLESENSKSGNSQDLISRVKRRRIEAAERREQEEKERIKWEEERQRLFEEQEKEAEHNKVHKQLRDAEIAATKSSRLDPLGTDRNHNRYWLFSDNTPGLYVEKGWIQDYIHYCTKAKDIKDDEMDITNDSGPSETSIPHVGQNLWFVVDTKEKLDELIKSLCSEGIREHQLKKSLEKKYNHIIRSIAKYEENLPKPPVVEEKEITPTVVTRKSLTVKDAEEDCKKSLQKRLNTIINDLTRGGLSNIEEESDIFIARVESAQDISEFSTLMIDIFNAIDMRYFREYMSGITTKKNQSREELLPYEEKEKFENPKKIAKADLRREKWMKAVQGASQYSRLSFLLTILHSSVMWEMYKYVRPKSSRSSSRIKNYAEMVQESQEEEEDEEEDEEEEEEEVIKSSSRSRRYLKRNKTEDSSEDEGTGTRRSKRNIGKRKRSQDSSEEAEEEETVVATRRSRRKVQRKKIEESSDDDDEEEEEEDSESQEEENDEEEESEVEEEEGSLDEASEGEEDENEDLEKCSAVINRLLQYKCSNLFKYRVEEEDVPDYYEIVENPISITDIKDKIEKANGSAERPSNSRTRSATRPVVPQTYTPDQLLDDVMLLLDNAEMYNGKDSFVWKQATKLRSAFCRCFLDNFRHSVRLTKRLKIFANPNDN
ncbi:tyrosine-protein kinase BAZ1B-like [Styela clava]